MIATTQIPTDRGTLKGDMLGHDRTCRVVDILKVTHKGTAVSDAACLTSLL